MTDINHADRTHALLSASSAHRWMKCPASAKLAELYPRTETPFTREGTIAHEVCEFFLSGRAQAGEVLALQGVKSEEFTPEMIRHAEAYCDYVKSLCDDGAELMIEQRVDYSQWVPEGFGTADCIILHTDLTMDVIDFKYGAGVKVEVENNPQMMLYALGALYDYGFVYEVEKVRMHIFQPRVDNISVAEMTVNALLDFADEVRPAALAALSDAPAVNAGAWCKFCPHAGRCSALAKTCISSVSDGAYILPDSATLAPEAIADILKREPMITAWLKGVRAQALTDMLNGKSIPDFKVVEGKLGNRAWSDPAKVCAALDAAGVDRSDYTETVILSPAAMDKAIGKKKVAELLGDLISRSAGSPTIAPMSDKRKAYDREAEAIKDFE